MNVVLCGVGGQGVLTMSRAIAEAARNRKLPVFIGETLGMSQRGGSVQSYVRLGEDAVGPLIPEGRADLVVALEALEALRALPLAGQRTVYVVCPLVILPVPSALRGERCSPEEVAELISKRCAEVRLLEKEAIKGVSRRCLNAFVLGYLSANSLLPFEEEVMLSALLSAVRRRYEEENRDAFKRGTVAEAIVYRRQETSR